ncbi:actin maturation protease isoform X2 [Denticeps clupeoides]|uniref:actin maturation protease isoform X2 n=1 Tax=Denticeps clupeoides TaxID=299321 RepID=UPI0010A4C3FE|nr:UPF0692 protein C19orf54 homolog isoform X2 [Denticeps clupeoides]
MSADHPGRPPAPPPPPPPPRVAHASGPKKKLYQALAEGKAPVEGDHKEALLLLKQRDGEKDLQWVLFNRYVPSMIQDGPQCGLVALWMGAQLLWPPRDVPLEAVVQRARASGYTAQGEMFSARDMALLAEELYGCEAELLKGGMDGDNARLMLKHLAHGQPALVPYDEDFNHEPCQRCGHRAHWAVASGVLVGVSFGTLDNKKVWSDPTLPWVLLARHGDADLLSWSLDSMQEVYVLAKQGKSLRYQLWHLETVAQSNAQLRELDPHRANDGTHYVLPPGGVEEGLAGKVVLLHTRAKT